MVHKISFRGETVEQQEQSIFVFLQSVLSLRAIKWRKYISSLRPFDMGVCLNETLSGSQYHHRDILELKVQRNWSISSFTVRTLCFAFCSNESSVFSHFHTARKYGNISLRNQLFFTKLGGRLHINLRVLFGGLTLRNTNLADWISKKVVVENSYKQQSVVARNRRPHPEFWTCSDCIYSKQSHVQFVCSFAKQINIIMLSSKEKNVKCI